MIVDNAGQRVGAETVPNGDRRIARRYRPNQTARFRADSRLYYQRADDVRVMIEIGFLWVVGGAVFLGIRRHFGGTENVSPGGSSKINEGPAVKISSPPDASAPTRKPDYEPMTPEQRQAAILELKRWMDSGHLQLEKEAPESERVIRPAPAPRVVKKPPRAMFSWEAIRTSGLFTVQAFLVIVLVFVAAVLGAIGMMFVPYLYVLVLPVALGLQAWEQIKKNRADGKAMVSAVLSPLLTWIGIPFLFFWWAWASVLGD
jgi:hypothetical protein